MAEQDNKGRSTGVRERTRVRSRKRTSSGKPPSRYKVVLHNDDVTTMDFVVRVLMEVFFYSEENAHGLMMKVHTEGSAVAGVYDYDTATSKVFKVKRMAEQENFPLKLTVEPQ